MKKITLFLLLIAAFASAQTNNYQNGDTVDDFTVTDTDGNEHNLYSITSQGKYVWLDFFFVDCGPCRATAAIFNEFYDKYGCNENEVYCLSINLGNDDDNYVKWYEETFGGTFNHAPAASGEGGSGAVTTNFGVQAFPTYCLIGPDNKMILRDIWPVNNVQTLEGTFPTGFNPEVAPCSLGVVANQLSSLTIYPTISDGTFNIELPTSANSLVSIFNSLGQKVFEKDFQTQTLNINLSGAHGVYMVKVTQENQSAVVKRVIIK